MATYALNDNWQAANPYISSWDARSARVALNDAGTNYWNTAAFDYFSDSAIVGDYLYFAVTRMYWGIKLEVGTAFSATSVTFVWEYKTGSSTWATLRVDNPNALLSTGTQIVQFTPPDDLWYGDREKGMPIRCRISALSGITEGGANATNKVEWNFKNVSMVGTESSTSLSNAVTADLAGTFTTMAATTCTTGMIPMEMPLKYIKGADMCDFVLSGTSAGAGDTLDITGQDVEGNTITESIDVSAGDGTYTTTLAYNDITTFDCTGWADGTVAVTQKRWGMIHNIYADIYMVGTFLRIGDDSTTTTWTMKHCLLQFRRNCFYYVMGKTTFTRGEIANGQGMCGGTIRERNAQLGIAYNWNRCGGGGNAAYIPSNNLVMNHYGADHYIENLGYNAPRLFFESTYNTITDNNVMWRSNSNDVSANPFYTQGASAYTYQNVYWLGGSFMVSLYNSLGTTASHLRMSTTMMAQGTQITDFEDFYAPTVLGWYYNYDGRINTINSPVDEGTFTIGYNGMSKLLDCIHIQFTLDIRVLDEAGEPIEDAEVTLTDSASASALSATTDASGDISTANITWKKADHASGASTFTWYTKTPHTLKIKKSGYAPYESELTMNEQKTMEVTLKRQHISIDQETQL